MIFFTTDGREARLSLATTRLYKGAKSAEWHRVVLAGELASVADPNLGKGSLVYVEGRLRTRRWSAADGRKCRTTEVWADRMHVLDFRPRQRNDVESGMAVPPPPRLNWEEIQRDIPF